MTSPDVEVFVDIDDPYTQRVSSASIPIALSEAEREGRLKPGDTVVMVGFGAGLTWGAGVMQWATHPAPVREDMRALRAVTAY